MTSDQDSSLNDYDGHTNFEELTPEQKLNWLASLVILGTMSKKIPRD